MQRAEDLGIGLFNIQYGHDPAACALRQLIPLITKALALALVPAPESKLCHVLTGRR
jgi:hypothetical protein